jgi:hypothetical protein
MERVDTVITEPDANPTPQPVVPEEPEEPE